MTDGRHTLDVAPLPTYAFGNRGLIWWGTVGFMVIEGSMFVIGIVVYFYLRLKVTDWPPSLPNPDLRYGTINLVVVLASILPAVISKRAAEKFDLPRARFWLIVLILFGLAAVVLRAFEYTTLNCRWDDNAYGSIVWTLLGLHTLHLVTDVLDTGVLSALMLTELPDGRRFVDISENALYWYFVVLTWLPLYAVVYWAPRSV